MPVTLGVSGCLGMAIIPFTKTEEEKRRDSENMQIKQKPGINKKNDDVVQLPELLKSNL